MVVRTHRKLRFAGDSPQEEARFEHSVSRPGKHCCRGLTYASRPKSRKQRYRRSARGIASNPAVPSMFFHCGRCRSLSRLMNS